MDHRVYPSLRRTCLNIGQMTSQRAFSIKMRVEIDCDANRARIGSNSMQEIASSRVAQDIDLTESRRGRDAHFDAETLDVVIEGVWEAQESGVQRDGISGGDASTSPRRAPYRPSSNPPAPRAASPAP